jgi:two-component sensor histidine kinase
MQAIQIKNEIATVIGADHSAISTEFLLLRELSHRINNEFTLLIGLVQCCIMDNGSSRGSHRPGQGLRIVDALAKEMNGRIDHRFGAGGATSILRFPISSSDRRYLD